MADHRQGQMRASRARVLLGFIALFLTYQASEGLQTVFAPKSPLGPALMVATLLLGWPIGRWLGWRGYDAYGLDLAPRSLALVVAGMLLAGLAFLASRSLGAAIGAYRMQGFDRSALLPLGIAGALVTTFIPSLAEDIITRGFLLKTFQLPLTMTSYVAGSALLYTANHVWRFDWGISEQVRLFCLGLAYGAAAWRWQSLWGAVALHWGWNFANSAAGALIPTEILQSDSARAVSAIAHLILLAIILLAPAPRFTRAHRQDEGRSAEPV